MLQEAAQAEAEKKQKAQEKKDKKEQEQKAKEERKRQREEKKKDKEANKASKANKATNKTGVQPDQGKDIPADDNDRAAEPGKAASKSPSSPYPTMPSTPKRTGSLITATPRQKEFVKRRRLRAEAGECQSKPGSSKVEETDGKGEAESAKALKEKALHGKVMESYQLLLAEPNFAKEVQYIPALDANKPTVKSFTAYPYEQGKSSNGIGVLLYRPAFYVRHATISDRLLQVLKAKGVKAEVSHDSNKGCSLGWMRFANVMQAYLSIIVVLACGVNCICTYIAGRTYTCTYLRWNIAMAVAGWVPEDKFESLIV